MPKNVNLFIHVVDNLGDIGFGAEVIRSFEELYPARYFFDIWTNEVEKVKAFFDKNPHLNGLYSMHPIEKIQQKIANTSFLLFHHPIPTNYPYGENELFLRIDYLSFDTEWVQNHGKEHIDSKESKRIIEIIPSPLLSSGGMIPTTKTKISRTSLAEEFSLDVEKQWVSIFAYNQTISERLIPDLERSKYEVLLLSGKESIEKSEGCTILPLLSLVEFSNILSQSKWAIIRGEVSFISTLQLGTPFFWDMYKAIGGFHKEQAEDYLDWMGANEAYRDILYRLNGERLGNVSLSEIEKYFQTYSWKVTTEENNLVKEMQKYIDKYQFSL